MIDKNNSKRFFLLKSLRKAFLLMCIVGLVGETIAAPKSKSIPYWNKNVAQSNTVIDHSSWQSTLSQYLDDEHLSGINRFAYSTVSDSDLADLQRYLTYLQSLAPTTLNPKEQFAYWVNLYNAQTVNLVVKQIKKDGDIRSIKQIRSGFFKPGPWSMKTLVVEQRKISLDDIEHGILRPNWQDHRIHYVLNCASLGCPNLQKTAFTSSNADKLMSKSEKEFINHPRGFRRDGDTLVVSKLFKWYRIDFANDEDGLIEYLAKINTTTKVSDDLDVDYEYDWGLNSPKSAAKKRTIFGFLR